MFKKILVCLDGSETAEKIIPFVREEAQSHGSEVMLLRVVNPPDNLTIGMPGFPAIPFHTSAMPEKLKEEYDIAEAYLEQVAQPIRQQGIQVQCEIIIGSPGPSIIDYANDADVDLIAMVSHGHSNLRNVLLGSVAEYIVRESGLPMLMIKAGKPSNLS